MAGEPHIRVGIAGAGFIGAVHARSARLSGGHIVGVAASSPESARSAADRIGADRAFESAEALAESDEIDVVHVCTPNHLHVSLTRAALDAGKHVICEKPLALDVGGAHSLVEAATGSGLQAAVPLVYRYYPMVREARERVRRGSTGPLRLLHGTYLQDWLSHPDDHNWRVEEDLGGASRAFADIGSHWCDLIEFVSGHRITRLTARTTTTLPERRHTDGRRAFERGDGGGTVRRVQTEDAALVQFETDAGALGSVVVSQVSPGRRNRLWIELDGSDESLVFDQENPEQLWTGRRDGANISYRDPGLLSEPAARFATLPAGHPQGYADCFEAMIADVYAAIRGAELPEGTPVFADGLRSAEITAAVLESASSETWVAVPTQETAEVAG